MKNNDTQQQMNTPNPNLQLNNYGPAQPVPVAYQAPVQPMPIIIQQGTPQPNVVVIEEKRDSHADNCCYCKAPRQSACGCLEPNKYYCCFLIVSNYFLLGLQYILTCLCIVRLCQIIC